MPEPQDVEELQSEEVESEDVEVNRDLFKDQYGFRIAFFLHKSIKKSFSRRNLTRDIERHGGIVLDTDIGCDTVLVDVMYDKKEALQISYNTDDDPRLRKVFVELTSFIQHCIRYNLFVHRLPALKGMGGTVGRFRVPFTEDDDRFLYSYLARILPDKASGGRLGLEVYKALVRTAEAKPDTHGRGARHTAESWRERYKKNALRFDELIEDTVKREGRSRKQLWHEDRRSTHKYFRGKHKYELEEDPSEEDFGEEDLSEEDFGEEDPSEEDYKEEKRPQPSRKRRRTTYSPLPPNRRRAFQRSSDRKGKARAEGDEEPHQPHQLEDHVDQDKIAEPGLSRSLRSLEATATAADDLTHRTQPNTASFFTQETIVASTSSGNSVQASHLPDEAAKSSSLVRPSIQVTRGVKQASSPGREPLAVIDLTLPSGSVIHNSPFVQLSPTRTLVNASQTQEAQPSTYKQPRKAARRPRAMIEAAVVDAPYRNTRSRSQSVEPSMSRSPVRGSKKRQTKEAQKSVPALATVDEMQDDDGQNNEVLEVADESVPHSAGEILADEIDVEKMLISDDEEMDDVDYVRGESLDTDDAQTEQDLRPTQPRQAFGSFRRHPSEVLKEFQEYSVIRKAPSTARPYFSNRTTVPVRNTLENSGSIPPPCPSRDVAVRYKVIEPPRTPLKRPRNNSTSSVDLFPVSGTRASALKNKLQQQEKRSPYKPPSGTRAAKFAHSRR